MKKIKEMTPYLFIILLSYFSVFFIRNTGFGILIILLIIPIICFICSMVYGFKKSFNIIYILLIGILFIPFVFIILNSSALIYCLIYPAISLIGNIIGIAIKKLK